MKIRVIKRSFSTEYDTVISYKIVDVRYCCDEIKDLPNVNFYYQATENTSGIGEAAYSYDLGIMLVNSVTYHDNWYDSCDYTEDYYYKLNYCPVCGEKIEVEVIDSIDLTKEYEKLKKERDEVHQKCIKTDSIKKKNEYLNRRQELDQQIEELYNTDILPQDHEIEVLL